MSKDTIKEVKALKGLVESLLAEVKSLKAQNKLIEENTSATNQHIADLSSKLDEIANVADGPPAGTKKGGKKAAKSGPKTRAAKKKTDTKEKKKWANIMTYFKTRYIADQDAFSEIISDEEQKDAFADHKDDLKDKSGEKLTRAKATVLYKYVIKGDKEKSNKLRAKMNKENEEHKNKNSKDAAKDDSDSSSSDSDSD